MQEERWREALHQSPVSFGFYDVSKDRLRGHTFCRLWSARSATSPLLKICKLPIVCPKDGRRRKRKGEGSRGRGRSQPTRVHERHPCENDVRDIPQALSTDLQPLFYNVKWRADSNSSDQSKWRYHCHIRIGVAKGRVKRSPEDMQLSWASLPRGRLQQLLSFLVLKARSVAGKRGKPLGKG